MKFSYNISSLALDRAYFMRMLSIYQEAGYKHLESQAAEMIEHIDSLINKQNMRNENETRTN